MNGQTRLNLTHAVRMKMAVKALQPFMEDHPGAVATLMAYAHALGFCLPFPGGVFRLPAALESHRAATEDLDAYACILDRHFAATVQRTWGLSSGGGSVGGDLGVSGAESGPGLDASPTRMPRHGSKSSSNPSASLVPTLVIPIKASYSYGKRLEVDTGVVGSDLCLFAADFASFSPAESSECSLSVSLTPSSRGSAPCTVDDMDGGPFSLRLLPAVGCRSPESAIVYCAEEPFQQLLWRVVTQLSQQSALPSTEGKSDASKMRVHHTYYFLQVIPEQSPISLLVCN